MPGRNWWLAAAAVVSGLVAWYLLGNFSFRGDARPDAPAEPAPVPESPQRIRHPVPGAQIAATLPTLEASDQVALAEAAAVMGQNAAERHLIPDKLIRRTVVTIDNLPRSKVAVRQRPVAATSGQFVTMDDGQSVTLSPDNYARYRPFVEVVQAAETERVAAAYFQLYPLFQQAYEELGHPGRYFNDRVIEVIDHLLETPDVAGPIRLVQPKAFYQFEDPALESRSAGQKILIRMGSDNAAVVKQKLRELKAALIERTD